MPHAYKVKYKFGFDKGFWQCQAEIGIFYGLSGYHRSFSKAKKTALLRLNQSMQDRMKILTIERMYVGRAMRHLNRYYKVKP